MKITFFGLSISSSWGNDHAAQFRAVLGALHRLGHQVVFYERDLPELARHRDLNRSADFELRLYESWDAIRQAAVATADDSDAVVVASHVPEGARISDAVLALNRPLRVYYEMNAPHTLERLKHGSLDYVRALQLPDFDLVLSRMGGRSLGALELDYGARMALPLYVCVDPDLYHRMPARPALRCELSYLGSCPPQRMARLEALMAPVAQRRPSWKILLGRSRHSLEAARPPRRRWRRRAPRWAETKLPPSWPGNAQWAELASTADFRALLSSSRLTLDLPRRRAEAWGYCPSGRLFTAAACCTPVVTTGFEGLELFLEPGSEVLVAEDAAGLLAAMERSDAELLSLARRARQRTLDEHTGYQRALTMLAAFDAARAPRLLRLARAGMDAARALPPHVDRLRVG